MAEWETYGDNWSGYFKSVPGQWITFLLPRIYTLIKGDTILELAQGCGRWTYFLKDLFKTYKGVDLSEYCVNVCRERFKKEKNTTFFLNDGKDLSMIKDNSVDFIFSFDSLVHADLDAMKPYIKQIKQKLKKGCYAFIHHSELASYKNSKPDNWEVLNKHWRSPQVDHLVIQNLCKKYNLHCVSQEIIRWSDPNGLKTDCISIILNDNSIENIPTRIIYDEYYHKAAKYSEFLFKNYNLQNSKQTFKTNYISKSSLIKLRKTIQKIVKYIMICGKV